MMPATSIEDFFFTSLKKSTMPETSSAAASTISTTPTMTDTRSCACSSSQTLAATARTLGFSSVTSGTAISFARETSPMLGDPSTPKDRNERNRLRLAELTRQAVRGDAGAGS